MFKYVYIAIWEFKTFPIVETVCVTLTDIYPNDKLHQVRIKNCSYLFHVGNEAKVKFYTSQITVDFLIYNAMFFLIYK